VNQPPPPQDKPVTYLELNDLREHVKGNPTDYKTQFKLARRLVEAADVLADEEGNADQKTKNKNREKFILEAHKNIKKLVQHSYTEAMFYLADCHGTGQLGLAVDHKEAFNLYQAAAKLGHPAAAYRTAVCCEVGGEGAKRDPVRAVQWYRRAAALGEVGAMYKLGMVLLKGLLGQQSSVGEAVIWLNRAAERAEEGGPHALHELALLHEMPPPGGKIIKDEKYALQLYEQAAKMGYPRSQTRLGKAFETGLLNVPIDDRASIHWFSKAAAQGDAEAELALSGWYLTGARGVLEPNEAEAYLWARKSADREFPKAEYAMGYYSQVGIGCPTNLEDAKRWYGRSACKCLQLLRSLLTVLAHHYVKAQQKLEDLRRGRPQRGRERISRSQRNEECVVM
jgi:TPR repeat protein